MVKRGNTIIDIESFIFRSSLTILNYILFRICISGWLVFVEMVFVAMGDEREPVPG